MTARLLMPATEVAADKDQWLALRLPGITASEIASAMGIQPPSYDNGSPFALYVSKVTGSDPDRESAAMIAGRHLEPVVAELLEKARPDLKLYPGGLYCQNERPWQLATFDRLAHDPASGADLDVDGDGSLRQVPDYLVMPVQIKVAHTRHPGNDPDYWWGDAGTNYVPVNIRAQVMWEMDVAGASRGIVAVLFMDTWQCIVYVIDRDAAVDADLEVMRKEAVAFLARVEESNPPPLDGTRATTLALKRMYGDLEDREVILPKALARRYRAAWKASKRAEARLGVAWNQVLARMGNARYAMVADDEGELRKVVTRTKFGREYNSADVLRNQFPEAYTASRRSTPVDQPFPGTWTKK